MDGRNHATAADEVGANSPDGSEVRAQIIAAAHRLLERNGKGAVTLSAVAAEAELARATIHAHFTSRKELLAQMSQQRRAQAGSNPHAADASVADVPPQEPAATGSNPEPTDEAAPATAPEVVASDEANPPVDPPVPAEAAVVPTQTIASPDLPSREEQAGYDELMRAQAEVLDELAKRVIVPKSMRRDGTDVAISRAEARLAVAEQSLAALERTISEKLKAVASDAASLSGSLEETRRRLDKLEERHQMAIAQLRLDIHNLSHPSDEPAPLEPELPQIATPPSKEAQEPVVEPSAPAEPQAPPMRAGYLDSARQAAIHAAQNAQPGPARSNWPHWLKMLMRWRWPLIAALALLVALFDAYVFTHYPPAGAAVTPPARVVTAPKPHRVLTPEAQLAKGLKFLNGRGIPVDVERAVVWIERAAGAGQPVAQNYMGVLYQTGTGVHANIATAVRWYEAAARSGNLKAMTNLGKVYAGGWPEGTDYSKAAEWFGRAAGFGDVDAQFDLAVLYERGAGVLRSASEAYKWYIVAGARGDANAAERATVLASQLSPNELLAAQAAAALFRPAKVDSAANDVPN